MKITHLAKMLLLAVVAIATITACQDDFSEEDFLTLQAQLSEQKAAADATRELARIQALAQSNQDLATLQASLTEALMRLEEELVDEDIQEALDRFREAGLLSSLQLFFENDGVPVEGATVSISETDETAGESGRLITTTTAGGFAIFTDITIGSHIVTVSADGFIPVTFVVTVDLPESEGTGDSDGNTGGTSDVPNSALRTLSAIIQLFADSDAVGSTATIEGTVTIQSDLTSSAKEVPSDVTVSVDLTELASGSGNASGTSADESGLTVSSYRFTVNAAFGTAPVDPTTGAFTLVVPAESTGSTVQLLLPSFEIDQTLAAKAVDGAATTDFVGSATARFGSNIGADDVPFMAGFVASVAAPPAGGEGFELSFTAIPRTISGSIDDVDTNETGIFSDELNADWAINPGLNLDATPIFTSTPAGATADADMHITSFTSVVVGDPGTGYAAYRDGSGPIPNLNNYPPSYNARPEVYATLSAMNGTAVAATLSEFWVTLSTAVVGGNTVFVPDAQNAAIFNTVNFEVNDDWIEHDVDATYTGMGIALKVSDGGDSWLITNSGGSTAPKLSVSSKAQVEDINFGGTAKFVSSSAPSYAVSGVSTAADVVAPSIAISELRTQWSLAAGTASSGYVVAPEVDIFWATPNKLNFIAESFDADKIDLNDIDVDAMFTVNAEGQVSFANPLINDNDFVSNQYAATSPVAEVNPASTKTPGITVEISSGTVAEACITSSGEGYAERPEISVVPRQTDGTGSGADIRLININTDEDTGTLIIGKELKSASDSDGDGDAAVEIFSGGSGYVANLNKAKMEEFGFEGADDGVVSVKAGETVSVVINYGTGSRLNAIGDDGEAKTCEN